MRDACYAVRFTDMHLKSIPADLNEVSVSPGTLRELLAAPSFQDMCRQEADTAKRAFIAGDYLSLLYLMRFFPGLESEPSVRKAIWVIQAVAQEGRYGDGSPMPRSDTAIRACFEDFGAVAHLWGALGLRSRSTNPRLQESFSSTEIVREFLGLARTLQDFGCAFVPKRAKPRLPILDRSKIWTIPESITPALPIISGPAPWFVDALQRYRTKSRPPTD